MVDLDEHRPHVVVTAEGKTHVIPISVLEQIADGTMALHGLDDHEPILRTIVREWLDRAVECV